MSDSYFKISVFFFFLRLVVGYMVTDFGLVVENRDAGEYAGYIAGSYFVGAIFGSFGWGYFSDK